MCRSTSTTAFDPILHIHNVDILNICMNKFGANEIFLYNMTAMRENLDIRDFNKCGILTCVDSDEPLQPPFKLRISIWCSVSSVIIIEYSSD